MSQQSFSIFRGEAVSPTWTLEPVVDITGWTFLMTVSKQANSASKVLQATPTVVNGPAGVLGVTLASSVTAALAPGNYYWDVWRNDAGLERVLAYGALKVQSNARFPS